jgi:hypothetical protein
MTILPQVLIIMKERENMKQGIKRKRSKQSVSPTTKRRRKHTCKMKKTSNAPQRGWTRWCVSTALAVGNMIVNDGPGFLLRGKIINSKRGCNFENISGPNGIPQCDISPDFILHQKSDYTTP